ncbi:MAG: glycosyltransferase [Armatimonadetes bacterium]|nr:glycosyltransferase [Armatimonadota bacterium]
MGRYRPDVVVGWIISSVYGVLVLVSAINLAWMPRLRRGREKASLAFLIPARNEAQNLTHLLPELVKSGSPVYVFDDESNDGTAEVARSLGARVVSPPEPLPEDWTGKNRACHELAKVASEDFDGDWLVFVDADVRFQPQACDALASSLARVGRRRSVVTGFPTILAANWFEAIYFQWVPWIILSTNPFGLVSKTGMGHNHFTNGQFTAWKSSAYWDIQPHSAVRRVILEDVLIGRLLAKSGIRVETMQLGPQIQVQMYANEQAALDGMSKNAFEIAGSAWGTYLLAVLMLLLGTGWLIAPSLLNLALLLLSGLLVSFAVRKSPVTQLVTGLLTPVSILMGAYTLVRSVHWRKSGKVQWKGRTYTK